ncbi:hypothetical protein QYE76_039104 [Lolium multiflorum]|uniref:Uncharacterized protein n=1 Tax=Lolium multiflorum TaxID=4521 RepID=A0AAD8WTJ9_LOLMU|nr:hypothetical protein QYE76_039104 [Lolium multiflorum]
MGEKADETSATLKQLQASLDLLHGVVAGVDTQQQQLRAQLDLQATAIADSAVKHDDTAKILHALMVRLKIPDPDPGEAEYHGEEEVEEHERGEVDTMGRGKTAHNHSRWLGNTPGASTSAAATGPLEGGDGRAGAGGSRPDSPGAGGGEGMVVGGGGGGRGGDGGGRTHSSNQEHGTRNHMPKLVFPRFSGEHPRVWRDQCLDYFRVFNISPSLWHTTASLHLDGNAAIWLQSYKQRHTIRGWPQFITAVEAEFGADDQRKSMKSLLQLQQTDTVQAYIVEFQSLMYQVLMFNPNYDEQFFVSQFIKGLKSELRAAVESQVPETLERAFLIARVQQEVQDDVRTRGTRTYNRPEHTQPCEATKPALKFATGDLWKDRQLREYRKLHNQCYRCGEPYNPTHRCGQKPTAAINAMAAPEAEEEAEAVILTEEVLNILEMQDISMAEQLSLSMHAMAGTEGAETLRLRALVGNQALIILVDSGSSSSFVHSHLLTHMQCKVTEAPRAAVKVANGQMMYSTQMVPEFTWWSHGATFVTPMRVLDLGAYDAILGMDWLKKHSPMTTDWDKKFLSFPYEGKQVTLHGLQASSATSAREVPVEQLAKWVKGRDIWAMAVVHTDDSNSDTSSAELPPEIQNLLTEFHAVFVEPTALPPTREYDHAIPLKQDAAPFNSRPYRYSPAHKDEIEKQVAAMLAAGIIVPSMSPFASPVLLVLKKDGTWRFCVDYRRLNELTVKNVFPMPVIDELLDELGGATVFSKLDLRAGYHQIRMLPTDEAKTAFKTHLGHYQFRVMPFGLCNAPATFQCVMNSILLPCLRRSVLVFMDDILVYSKSIEEHVSHLREVLTLLQDHQLYVKPSKCSFACSTLEYLGHIVSAHGVATDPKKTQAMKDWPQPTNLTELRGFLGLTGYYRKFVRNYGIIARSLTNLLKKKKEFLWDSAANEAFEALKAAMTTTPVLQLPDFSKTFVVETDACDTGIGAVLMQEGHPLAFLSKLLSKLHQSLSIYEKEFLALLMAVDRWRPYLQRDEFIIKTDHHSLCFLEDQNLQSPLQRKAMARLMGLRFKIHYKKGAENHAADSLSRVGHLLAMQTCSEAQPAWLQEVINSYATDPDAQKRLAELALHSPDENGYELTQGIIRFHGRIWLGANSAIQTKLITALHSSAVGGHSGIQATYQRIKKLFAWHGLKAAVTNFVQQCKTCQHAKHSTAHPQGLLQPLPIPDGAWKDITMDFIEGLPLSDRTNVILVVVDRFTKVAHFLPLKHPYTAQDVARVFVDGIVKLHGMPRSITSDRDTIFTSHFWKTLFKTLGTKLNYTTAYHPQTDGQSERVNQCLEMFLRCMVQDEPTAWRRWLPLAEFWYNATTHTSIGCSPFKALYGHEPNMGAMPELDTVTEPSVAGVIKDRAAQLELLKKHLTTAQLRMKTFADRNRTEKQFQVGDAVLLKLQPYAQATVINRPYPKLAYKYFGPYKILDKVGQVSYRLELPEGTKVHNVFHVSQLKEFRPDYTPVFAELPKLPLLDSTETAPERILDRRLVKKGNAALPQMLIKWKHLPEDAATWEDWDTLKARFPEVLAWGQASVREGEPVTP